MKILKFYADWCGPCKQLTKTIDKFKESHPDIEIVAVNVEDEEETTNKYNISSVPVLVKLDDTDTEVNRITGNISLQVLEEFILNAE